MKRPSEALLASIKHQVTDGIRFLERRYEARVFLLYLQAFSNTYGEREYLKAVYDYALSLGDFRELIIATRPDCVDASVAELVGSYRRADRDVWVELGLQSACDATLARIRRGHTVSDFEHAFRMLRSEGVKIACHLILGLPGETMADMMRSVDFVASLEPEAVKFHDLHVPIGTALYDEYLEGELSVATGDRHLGYLVAAIERLPPETIIMRLTCDTPDERRAAPRYPLPKNTVYDRLVSALESRGTWQGSGYRS